MAQRFTRKDVTTSLGLLKAVWERCEITRTEYRHPYRPQDSHTFTARDLVVTTGSKVNGQAYRLFYRHPDAGGLYSTGMPNDYLGMTAREAVVKLNAFRDALTLAAEAKENAK